MYERVRFGAPSFFAEASKNKPYQIAEIAYYLATADGNAGAAPLANDIMLTQLLIFDYTV